VPSYRSTIEGESAGSHCEKQTAKQEIMAAVTIGRGLLRLWVVMSVCWVLAIGAITLSTLPPDIRSDDLPDAPWEKGFNPDDPYSSTRSMRSLERIESGAVLASAPPIVVLVLGLAFAWVVRGFRHQQPKI
jgi:hypothetical protein